MDVVHTLSGGDSEDAVVEAGVVTFTISLSGTLAKRWEGLDAHRCIAEAIIVSHDPDESYKPVYRFDSDNTNESLEATLDWIKRNHI